VTALDDDLEDRRRSALPHDDAGFGKPALGALAGTEDPRMEVEPAALGNEIAARAPAISITVRPSLTSVTAA